MDEIRTWEVIPEVKIVGQFFSHPAFIEAFTGRINKYEPAKFDHVLFSFHGLPVSHLQKIHPGSDCQLCNCNEVFREDGVFCYKAACYETTRLLAHKLNLNPDNFSTSFQSRLSKNWITPFTDNKLRELALSGKKKVLVIVPSFVADCLETIIEINDEYSQVFKSSGGEIFVLSETLNDNDKWAEAVIQIANLD